MSSSASRPKRLAAVRRSAQTLGVMNPPLDPDVASQVIELLKRAKPLFESKDDAWLATVGALGAIGGALAAFFPNYWIARRQERQLRESVAVQIYAEIQATLELERHRKYIANVRELVTQFERNEISGATYSVDIADDRFPVFKAQLPHLGRLPFKLQQRIVLFYQTLEGVIQDIRPGGYVNARSVGKEPFIEVLGLLTRARALGEEVLAEIERLYPGVR